MNFLRKFLILMLVLAIGATCIKSEYLIQLGLTEMGLSWMNSYILPKGLLLLLATCLALLFRPILKDSGGLKFVGIFLIFGLSIGGYLLLNTPYTNDWTQYGKDVTLELAGNPIDEFLNRTNPDFDGVICLALPGCPHCEAVIPKLSLLQTRKPDLNVLVFVFSEDSLEVESIKSESNVDNLPFIPVPDPLESIKICRGKFPTFLYFKDGKIVHRWFNSQFGYRTLDWIEKRLE